MKGLEVLVWEDCGEERWEVERVRSEGGEGTRIVVKEN